MEQVQEILKILSEIKETLDSKNRDEVYSSTTNVQSIFDRFYSKESPFIKDLSYVREKAYVFVLQKTDEPAIGPDLSYIKIFYNHLLESLIKEIERLGTPSKNDISIDNSIRVNVNQQQTQEQLLTAQFSIFLEFIKDDITQRQYKELIEIVKNEQIIENAKPKIIAKLKSFGENVCSNIIANILTNPSIWNSMIG